jgi:hypothetical protein
MEGRWRAEHPWSREEWSPPTNTMDGGIAQVSREPGRGRGAGQPLSRKITQIKVRSRLLGGARARHRSRTWPKRGCWLGSEENEREGKRERSRTVLAAGIGWSERSWYGLRSGLLGG